MSSKKNYMINNLLHIAPYNGVLTASWLHEQGYSPQLITRYCHSGWLEPVGRGAYLKAGDELTWEGALSALQNQLKLPIHPGGQTALAMHGESHYVTFRDKGVLQFLFASGNNVVQLPKWFADNFNDKPFVQVHHKLFQDNLLGLTTLDVGGFKLIVSRRERAILEMLSQVPERNSYEHAFLLAEGLRLLVSGTMQELLESCKLIKAKRLFLYFAEQHNLPCFDKLDVSKIDLGHGNRKIGVGGRYVAKYQLSVPILQDDEDLESLEHVQDEI